VPLSGAAAATDLVAYRAPATDGRDRPVGQGVSVPRGSRLRTQPGPEITASGCDVVPLSLHALPGLTPRDGVTFTNFDVMTKSRNILGPRKTQWSWVELEMLRLNYHDTATALLAEVLGLTVDQLHRKAHKLGLKKSVETIAEIARDRSLQADLGHRFGFKKGHVPANKGLRRPGWSAGRMGETQFKKGRPASESSNYRPIGSEKVDPKRGVLMRKMTDDPSIFPVKRWTPVHVLVWEAVHGPVPPGRFVRFKPGMKTLVAAEITIDRLECVTNAENLARNSVHNLPPELVKVIQLRGVLNRRINARSKEA